ncbi:MAG: hypothetical protein WEB50_14180 [Vicinamibacterales bacterium]
MDKQVHFRIAPSDHASLIRAAQEEDVKVLDADAPSTAQVAAIAQPGNAVWHRTAAHEQRAI